MHRRFNPMPIIITVVFAAMLLLQLAITPTHAQELRPAANVRCENSYYGQQEPRVAPRGLAPDRRLCGRYLAIGYSTATRTPIWVAQRLTPEQVIQGTRTERVSQFYADPRLRPHERAEPHDYTRSGFDRGHLAPSADFPGIAAQRESFTLANVAPQAPALNRRPWMDLEIAVRRLTRQSGVVWVVTGTSFQGPVRSTPNGRVAVPAQFWKAVAIPGRGSVVFIADNRQSGYPRAVPLSTFRERYGTDPFPALDAQARRVVLPIGL